MHKILTKNSYNNGALILCCIVGAVSATRVVLDPENEPTIKQVYSDYRILFADGNYFHMSRAGVLNDSYIPKHMTKYDASSRSSTGKAEFNFSAVKHIELGVNTKYMIALEEKLALHNYDDPVDLTLAAGPQVNQRMCGAHLDYMLYMIRTFMSNINNSTDNSIAQIMFSFGNIDFTLARSNTLFLGDYVECIRNQLNVMRDHFVRVNTMATDLYFKQDEREGEQHRDNYLSLMKELGPLIGILPEQRFELPEEMRSTIKPLSMRYCLAGLRLTGWRNDSYGKRNLILRLGTCLPETCDSKSINFYKDEIKQLVDFNMKDYYEGFYLDQLYCLPDEQSTLRDPMNYGDSVLFICFNFVWISLIVISTSTMILRSYYISPNNEDWKRSVWWRYLSSWCLIKNFGEFMTYRSLRQDSEQQAPGNQSSNGNNIGAGINGNHKSATAPDTKRRVNLEPLEGFKVISSISVLASHLCMIVCDNPWNAKESYDLMSRSWMASVLVVCPAVVDNFFVVTGILTSNVLMQLPRKQLQSLLFWPLFIFHRYIRIVPLYLLVHWFVQCYFRFLGSGPVWDYGTSASAWMSVCRNESLWTILMPSANFKSPPHHCNHVGWYLANDIQFCFLVPIFTLIYLKNYSLGSAAILGSCLLVLANYIRYYYNLDTDTHSIFEFGIIQLAKITDEAWQGYVLPQYRCLSFLIGLGAGQLLTRYEQGKIAYWPRPFVIFGKFLIFFNVYLLCFSPFIFPSWLPLDNEPVIRALGAIFMGSVHGLTSLATAFLIIFVCTGHLKCFAYVFSLDALKPLANTSLSVLLVHIPLLYYHSQSMTYLPELSMYHFFSSIIIWSIESFALAIVVHLLYEMPMRKFLLKLMFGLFKRDTTSSELSKIPVDQGAAIISENIALNQSGAAC